MRTQNGFVLISMMILLSALTLAVITMLNQLRLIQKNLHYEQDNLAYNQNIKLARQKVMGIIKSHSIPNDCLTNLTLNPTDAAFRKCNIPELPDIHYRVEQWPSPQGDIFVFYLTELNHPHLTELNYFAPLCSLLTLSLNEKYY